MNVFTVFLKNQPGELADLAEAVAARGANMMLCAVTIGSNGIVALSADNDEAVRSALEGMSVEFNERTALRVRLDDRPGMAAMLARKLSDANVNMELLLPVVICDGKVDLAVCVSDDAAARTALNDLVAG